MIKAAKVRILTKPQFGNFKNIGIRTILAINKMCVKSFFNHS